MWWLGIAVIASGGFTGVLGIFIGVSIVEFAAFAEFFSD